MIIGNVLDYIIGIASTKAVTTWQDKDEAFLNVVQGIRRVVEEMAKSKTS